MKIGVLSDTHIPKAADNIPEKVCNEFAGMDLIIHAGDLVELSVIEALEKLAPVKAVYGNMDSRDIRAVLPQKDEIRIGGFRIGIIHGYGPPKGIVDVVRDEFDKNIDIIVFGHSHLPLNERKGKTLLFNPGSPTDKVFAPYNSYGVIEIGDEIAARIEKI